jgi:hypothetical protein
LTPDRFNFRVDAVGLSVSPIGYIRGDVDESPAAFEFAHDFRDGGAMLTVVGLRIVILRSIRANSGFRVAHVARRRATAIEKKGILGIGTLCTQRNTRICHFV